MTGKLIIFYVNVYSSTSSHIYIYIKISFLINTSDNSNRISRDFRMI